MENATEEGSPAKSRAGKRESTANGLWNHALIAIGFAIVGIICATALIWWQLVASSNADHATQTSAALNSSFVGYANGRIRTLQQQVNALASAPQTVDALISYDDVLMEEVNARLMQQTAFARRVAIIPKGRARVELNAEIPISFAALDLIKRAETHAFVGPEVSLNQQDLLLAAQPITHEGVVAGVLFIALDKAGFFYQPLTYMDPKLGQVSILQMLDGSAETEVFSWGESSDDGGSLKTQLNANHWQLVFTPNLNNMQPVSSLTDLLSALAVILVFVLAGISIAFSSLARKVDADAQALTSYVTRLLRGRSATPEQYKLPVFKAMARGFAKYNKTKKGPAKKSSGKQAEATPKELLEAAKNGDNDKSDDLLDSPKEQFLDVASDAKENFGIEVSEDVSPSDMGLKLAPEIFRAYDIRGVVDKNLTEDVVYWLGRAFAAEAAELEQPRVAVGRDGRHSSANLRTALVRGLTEGGADVLDVGEVPTPLLYFATHAMDTGTGIMITGSHNPPDYNGLKMVLAGETLAEERIQALKKRIEENQLTSGAGDVEELDLIDHYIDRVIEDVVVAQPCKVVVDCGNGVAGHVAPRLLEELGCEVVQLYCEVDGDFPNHHPDPAEPANLQDLIAVVKDEDAELGIAFDGDGDRLGLVTASGEIIWPDRMLMLFAQDIVGRNPGADIIYDVKCSRHLNNLISEYGGRPIMWKTGHSHMKAKLKETGALLAGEFSGHICFGERWFGFDDALYAAARMLEIIGGQDKSIDELFKQFPDTFSTPEIKIETTEKAKFEIVDKLAKHGDWGNGTVTNIDGIRVDYSDGWGLLRASNTSPMLSLRFEADGHAALDRIKKIFQHQLHTIDTELTIG